MKTFDITQAEYILSKPEVARALTEFMMDEKNICISGVKRSLTPVDGGGYSIKVTYESKERLAPDTTGSTAAME